jgi:hypothetical protein
MHSNYIYMTKHIITYKLIQNVKDQLVSQSVSQRSVWNFTKSTRGISQAITDDQFSFVDGNGVTNLWLSSTL